MIAEVWITHPDIKIPITKAIIKHFMILIITPLRFFVNPLQYRSRKTIFIKRTSDENLHRRIPGTKTKADGA